jgi:hypothetical protein
MRPTLDAPLSGGAAPVLRPIVPSPAPVQPAISGSFEVPDLDVAPVSRPAPQRTSSGTRPAVAPALELDESPLELVPSASLELDLPSNDPFVRRASSGGMAAVRPSEPPPPGSLRTVRHSEPPVSRSLSPPPVTISAPGATSMPLAAPAAAPSREVAAPPKPAFQLDLAPVPDASLLRRLLPGVLVLGSAILMTILDQVYTVLSGEVFTLAGLRTSILAGLILVIGIGLCVYRLKRD